MSYYEGKHRELAIALEQELKKKFPDPAKVADLKKQKLALKDKMLAETS